MFAAKVSGAVWRDFRLVRSPCLLAQIPGVRLAGVDQALDGADVVVCTTPSRAVEPLVKACAPKLRDKLVIDISNLFYSLPDNRVAGAETTDEAVGLLEDVSIVELTEQRAEELLAKPLPGAPGTTPYLVRAQFLNKGTGRFLIYMSGDQISVFHGSLGGGERARGRQPLVLQLEEAPAEVYATARMVE